MKRVFIIVLDSLGIGAAPDAHKFGDVGTNTLKRISKSERFSIPTLTEMGIGSIDGIDYLSKSDRHTAAIARLTEISAGKDTTIGHWEIAGIISNSPLPTYPNGFGEDIISAFEAATGRGVLCNKPYSGTEVIRDFGDEHIKTGSLIVYTSADSVFQIAAHEDIIPIEELYGYCRIARELLVGNDGVGRVIARPFITENGEFKRTANRRDFSLTPPKKTMLDAIKEKGLDVIAIGKIEDIFAGGGITESYHSKSNADGMKICEAVAERDFFGLCFLNLVDFDSQYGHRENTDGYAEALSEFDLWLSSFKERLTDEDALIICADHGCDPGDGDTDHSREYTPLLIYGKKIEPKNLGTLTGFTNVAKICCDMLNVSFKPDGYEAIDGLTIKE
jgi:phosphopentomutase